MTTRIDIVREALTALGLVSHAPTDEQMLSLVLQDDPTEAGLQHFVVELSAEEEDEARRLMAIQTEAWSTLSEAFRRAGRQVTADDLRRYGPSHQRSALLRQQRSALREVGPVKEALRDLALHWGHCDRADPEATHAAILEHIRIGRENGHPSAHNAQIVIGTEDGSHMIHATAKWGACGMPVIRLDGHKYAAALMSTRVSADCTVEPPWPAFVIELPRPLLSTYDASGTEYEIEQILVHHHEARNRPDGATRVWSFMAMSRGPTLHSFRRTIAQFLDEDLMMDGEGDGIAGPLAAIDEELTERDRRVTFLAARLVVGTCLSASVPGALRPPRRAARGPHCKPSSPTHFRLADPVKIEIDCREAVRGFIQHGTRSPAVRRMVRGHWRSQACGPMLADRRLIWIRPHWKGPLDAPVLVRPHTMGDGA